MIALAPEELFQRLADDLPPEYLHHLIVVGSLAAAYHFREQVEKRAVKTKDADLLLYPQSEAQRSGREMAQVLRDLGWKPYRDYGEPQKQPEPVDKLPLIRLYPPENQKYFVEFLTMPESEEERGKRWFPVQLEDGWYGLCSFEFMGLTAQRPLLSGVGVYYARPSMMALANLLSHPEIRPETMSGLYGGRRIQRSNKDLGRVLSLAWLGDDETEKWAQEWENALKQCFPTRWTGLALGAAKGLRDLIDSDEALEEAWFTCDVGLLNGKDIKPEELRRTGQRLLLDALKPLEEKAKVLDSPN